MSRSRRRQPVTGSTSAQSDKSFKRSEHQRERHHVRQRLRATADDTDPALHRERFGNPLDAPKDGKYRWTRREPSELARAMRK